jgi:hypothetical protein
MLLGITVYSMCCASFWVCVSMSSSLAAWARLCVSFGRFSMLLGINVVWDVFNVVLAPHRYRSNGGE